MPRVFHMPKRIPGHKYADEVVFNGPDSLRVGGRPLDPWGSPFYATAASGTAERYAERVQAHKDRIMILKGKHTMVRRSLKDAEKSLKSLVAEQERRKRSLAAARARLATLKTQAARDRQAEKVRELQRGIDELADDIGSARETVRGHAKHMRIAEKEVNKLTARIPKNAEKKRRAAAAGKK